MESLMHLQLIAREVLYRGCRALAARYPHRVDVTFLPKGLHDLPAGRMRAKLQETIDAVTEGSHDAILLGYGLCNNGLHNVRARHIPLILPRAHDCITLFSAAAGDTGLVNNVRGACKILASASKGVTKP